MTEIEYISYSRIHMSLIDMNGELARRHMSFGVKLTNPTWTIRVRKCNNFSIVWSSELANRSQDIMTIVEKFEKLTQIETSRIEITISDGIPAHIGLGSTTSLFIGLIKSLSKYFDYPITASDTVKISKRGGVSGLGFIFNYLEKNGFVLDTGKMVPQSNSFKPSHFIVNKNIPNTLINTNFPFDDILLITPNLIGKFGAEELSLFDTFCPIDSNEVLELSRIILVKLLPDIVEGNKQEIAEAIDKIQTIGFKRKEINSYGEQITSLLRKLKNIGAKGIGMSSFGPCLYVLYGDFDAIEQYFENDSSVKNVLRSKILNSDNYEAKK